MSLFDPLRAWPRQRGVAVLLLAGAMPLRLLGAEPAAAPAKPALAVTLTAPQRAEWPTTLTAQGSIAAWQEAVISTEAQGLRLVELKAQVGDSVRRGQVLALLQSDTLGADLAVAKAGLAEAEAALTEATGNADRARALQPTGVISAQQTQQLLTAEATAKARVVSAKARQQAGEVRLAQSRILAPDDGVISARSATLGSVAAPGQELFRLIRQHRLEWRAEVAATDLARLKPGLPVLLSPAGSPPVRGTVRSVAPTVDATTRNGLVYVDLPQPGAARAGMFARGEFDLGRAPALAVPQAAVVQRDGFAYVFLLSSDQRVQRRKVSLGRRAGDQVEVLGGLDGNARVVSQGVGFLTDGDLVKVVTGAPVVNPAAPATAKP